MKRSHWLKFVWLLSSVLLIAFCLRLALPVRDNSRRMQDKRQLTNVIFTLYQKAYDSHLEDGGSPISEISQIKLLDVYFESAEWRRLQGVGPRDQKVASLLPRGVVDGFGNPMRVWRDENGFACLVSSGVDGIPNTEDDLIGRLY